MVLSTCNRTEVYISMDRLDKKLPDIQNWLDHFKECKYFSDPATTYQKTGEQVWSIQAERWEEGFSITSAPLYYDGMVITGFSGAEIGVRGRVTQDFNPGLRLGRVNAGGDDWRAECTSDHPLRVGDLVSVIRVESNTLIVEPLNHI